MNDISNHLWQSTLFAAGVAVLCFVLRLNLSRVLLLAAAGAAAINLPVGTGDLRAQPKADTLQFEIASIRPSDPNSRGRRFSSSPDNGLRASGVTLKVLVEFAYGVEGFQISGGPAWFRTDRFDIAAKPETPSEVDADERSQVKCRC